MAAASAPDKHPLESLGRGAAIALIGQIVLIGATFGSRVILVRSLSNSDYGDIALGISMVALISPVATIGIPFGVARQMAHARDQREKYRIAIAAVQIVVPLAVLAGVSLYFAAPVLSAYLGPSQMVEVLRFLAAYLTITIVSGLIGSIFQGEEDVIPNTLFSMIVTPLLLLAFLVAFFSTGEKFTGALLAYVLSSVVSFGGLMLYTIQKRSELLPSSLGESSVTTRDAGVMRDLLLFSTPLTMLGVAGIVTGNVDPLVLGYVQKSTTEVGIYSALLTMSRLLLLGVYSLAFIMLPVASRLHRTGDLRALGQSYATMIKWMLLFFVPLYALFMLFPGEAILLVYGSNATSTAYSVAPTVLRIVASGTMAACLLGPAQTVLTGVGKLRLLLYDTLVSAAVDVVGSLVLVPIWGIDGAAVAFALSTATLPLLAVIQTSIYASVHPFTREVVRPLASFVVLVVFLVAVPTAIWHLTPSAVGLAGLFFAMVGIYLGTTLVTHSLVPEDGHLLTIVEEYLGRPLPSLRALIHRFGSVEPTPAKHL